MAEIIPFPASRRVGQIRKTAAYMASASRLVAKGHLRMQLEKLARSLERRGVAPEKIALEVAAYRSAIETELWRAVLAPEGAA